MIVTEIMWGSLLAYTNLFELSLPTVIAMEKLIFMCSSNVIQCLITTTLLEHTCYLKTDPIDATSRDLPDWPLQISLKLYLQSFFVDEFI